MKQLLAALALVSCSASMAVAQAPEGFPRAGLSVLGSLYDGMIGGTICDRSLNWSAGGKFLRQKLGDTVTVNADGMSYIAAMAYAQRTLQEQMKAIPTDRVGRRQYCKTVTEDFGTHGSEIPGLVSDK